MKHKNRLFGVILLLFSAGIIALSILGPEILSRYRDRNIVGRIHQETAADEGEGYRYALSNSEKLYILSAALTNYQTNGPAVESEYQEANGSYAFIVNHRGPYEKQITSADVYDICNRQLTELKALGVLPDSVAGADPDSHTAVLYSAIDVLEPRNNVSVWRISLSDSQRNVSRQNKVMEVYLDADNGKIYECYVRSESKWSDLDPDRIAAAWCGYMELPVPVAFAAENPLLETATFFQKYKTGDDDGEEIVITVGFYEGINELFLKVRK